MKYILLVHHNEEVLSSLSKTDLQQMREESVRLGNDLNATGNYLDAAPLQPVLTAVSLRIREGKRLVTDGPFAETREQLGGASSSTPATWTRHSTSLHGFPERALAQ